MSFRTAFVWMVVSAIISVSLLAQTGEQARASSTAESAKSNLSRDGQHDFDFDFGTWKTHSSRLMNPLTGSTAWADMDGLTVVRKVWDGRANLAEFEADGPASRVELMALRFYNPGAHQWSLAFATPNVGTLSVPCIGAFREGRGDFYDQEEFKGRYILVRFSIWSITPDTAQSEQAFSEDGGKTWEMNWVNKYTRVSDQTDIDWSEEPSGRKQIGQHDFDFNIGVWHTQIHRILDPFTSASASMDISGTVSVRKVWGGRAELEEIEADGPKGQWEALTLFTFNPQARQWNQSFINSQAGILNSPLIGSFKNQRGELLNQDTFRNRAILVRGVWSDIKPNSHSYEESYSDDAGRTWKPAFIGHLTREK